jgi:peroxiredoxin
MAATPSTMLALGTRAPVFRLPDTTGRMVSLEDFQKKQGLVVMFICNHCPFVKHVRQELASMARDYQRRDVAVVAINTSDIRSYPDDSPLRMAVEVKEAGYTFPYLYDESQDVAKAYHAACTPDFYLFNKDLHLVYRGQMDSSRPGNGIPVTGKDLRAAVDAMLSGKPVAEEQKPSIGCNIKWRPGNEPDYYFR